MGSALRKNQTIHPGGTPMHRRDLLSTFGLAAGAIEFGRVLAAKAAEPPGADAAQASPASKPRYLIWVTEHLGIVFEADASALNSLLPSNLKPAAGNTVILNMYRAEQVVGLVPFTASFLWTNIEGVDSPDGSEARWVLQGWFGPEPVPTAIRTQLGLAVEFGATRVQRAGNRIQATLSSNGPDLIAATIALKEGGPSAVGGPVHYAALRRNVDRWRRGEREVGDHRRPRGVRR
jgi:hypothetical protein